MRHGVAGRKLGRTTAHREAMMRNMAVSLIRHGKIKTTVQKAKELRVLADNLVTLGKREDTVHTRRLAFDRLRDRDAVQKLFQTIVPAFKQRNGGYTRILKLALSRKGDAADMALIEYLREDLPVEQKSNTEKSKKGASAKKAKSTDKDAAESASEKPVKAKKQTEGKVAKEKSEKAPVAKKAKKSPAKTEEKKAASKKK